MILNYRYRIEPNKTQSALLSEMLGDFCELYNAALEHRIGAYKRGVTIRRNEQIVALPEIRRTLPHQGRWSATAQQQVLRKLEKTYQAFFGRVKRGQATRFPRFRARDRYHAADFRVGNGLNILPNGKLRFLGVVGEIKVRWHRPLPSKPKSAILSRNAGKWYIIFHIEAASEVRARLADSVGIDLGLVSLVALSTGELSVRPKHTDRAAKKLRRLQRALARCKRGSKARCKRKDAVAKFQCHIGNARSDHLHKITASLAARFGRIAIEDLNVKGLAGGLRAKQIHDAAWATLINMLTYKAERAGCELIRVAPHGTSQTCPECGAVAKKTLKERVHSCSCGCTLDRDVAAAMVIHNRAFGLSPGAGDGRLTWPDTA